MDGRAVRIFGLEAAKVRIARYAIWSKTDICLQKILSSISNLEGCSHVNPMKQRAMRPTRRSNRVESKTNTYYLHSASRADVAQTNHDPDFRILNPSSTNGLLQTHRRHFCIRISPPLANMNLHGRACEVCAKLLGSELSNTNCNTEEPKVFENIDKPLPFRVKARAPLSPKKEEEWTGQQLLILAIKGL